MSKVKASAVDGLKAQIDELTSDPNGAPGIVFAAVNKAGDIIFEHASGKTGVGQSDPMTMETVFWIASCTKMITGIACMQLVEQGVLKLDDVASVEKLCPELKAVKVLEESGKLVDKKQGITLRMLLSHTAGFGYSFFNSKLLRYYGAAGLDEFSGSYHDFLSQPLVNQPGERWEYGINIDYAGLCLERATGLSLNDYFQKHIFKPMGITHINMFPTPEMVSKLAFMNTRSPDGNLSPNPAGHLNRKPLCAKTKEEIDTTFNSGGAGSFARPAQYCQIIATLLNDGKHPGTGAQILKKETVDQMFTNQIPDMPDFARQVCLSPSLPPFLPPISHPSSPFLSSSSIIRPALPTSLSPKTPSHPSHPSPHQTITPLKTHHIQILTMKIGHLPTPSRPLKRPACPVPRPPRDPARLGPDVLPAPRGLRRALQGNRLVGRAGESVLVV